MKRLWICLALVAFVKVQCSVDDDKYSWQDDYWYDDELEQLGILDDSKSNEKVHDDGTINEVLDETLNDDEQFGKDIEIHLENQAKNIDDINLDVIKDYQFEDNRSEQRDENDKTVNKYVKDNEGSIELNDNEKNLRNLIQSTVSPDTKNNVLNLTQSQSTVVTESDDKFFEETKAILSEDKGNDFAQDLPSEKNQYISTEISEILEETKQILEKTKDTFDEEDKQDENVSTDKNSLDEVVKLLQESEDALVDTNDEADSNDSENLDTDLKNENSALEKDILYSAEEDTKEKAIQDLMADLDKLSATWDKLNDFETDINENENKVGDEDNLDDETILDSSDDYEEVGDDDLEKLFKSNFKANENSDEENEDDEGLEIFPDDTPLKKEAPKSHPILYLNDALLASESENVTMENEGDKLEKIPKPDTTVTNLPTTQSVGKKSAENIEPAVAANDLSSGEVEHLMKDFAVEHKNVFDIKASDVVNPIEVRLTVDEPTVVTSPNYPSPYPTNSITDWMFTGVGMGIELNITDFAINGFVGDYVIVKPGGVDESGSTGLLFSYNLDTERRYRFLDVDKMFIRFESKPGMQFSRGFSISAKMVVPRPDVMEPEPEPEPEIPTPTDTITLNLAGVNMGEFLDIQEQFRQIIADMATMYINVHGIDPGVNTTLEVTQVTSVGLCFHNWPAFEKCAEVAFGVPLVYDDDEKREPRFNETDLLDMWKMYSGRDPFAVRLRVLGITEYQVPNDTGVLLQWLVIAGGVLLSMALLAFALWRFNCFEDYSRMPSFSDTDSLNEKRNLDLYPTPHQTLPPLYTEIDYKWADAKYDDTTKVDMGGFSNRSYIRDDMFDSDEEIVPARDRIAASFSPRDIYNV